MISPHSSTWPEAMAAYPQGLNTPGRPTDPQDLRSGWQGGPGDQADRDLHFFDALLARPSKDHFVDAKRIYVEAVRQGNGCGSAGEPWAGGAATLYPSKGGTPLVTFLYPGGHAMDPAEPALIVRFFREHPPAGSQPAAAAAASP